MQNIEKKKEKKKEIENNQIHSWFSYTEMKREVNLSEFNGNNQNFLVR